MTMLGGVLIDAVLFRLFLRVFLHAVQCGVGDYAGKRDPVSDVVSELYGVALDLPSRAFGCWPIVLARSRSVRSQLR
jgi:hypothetical protein